MGTENISGFHELGVRGGTDYRETREFGGVTKIFCILIVVMVTLFCISQKSQNYKLKRVNFTICKLYFNKFYWKERKTYK